MQRTVRAAPPARGSFLERISVSILERALAQLEGGTLEVRLPNGTERRFGSGPPVRMEIMSADLFRRLATRGKLGLGESYTAGERRTADLVGLFELLLRN